MSDQRLVLSWKGHTDKPEGIAVLVHGDLSIALDLPNFKQANDLLAFIEKTNQRVATSKVKQVSAFVRGALDVSSNI